MEVSYSILIISMLFNMIYSVLMMKFGGFKNFFDVLMKGTISQDFGLIAESKQKQNKNTTTISCGLIALSNFEKNYRFCYTVFNAEGTSGTLKSIVYVKTYGR